MRTAELYDFLNDFMSGAQVGDVLERLTGTAPCRSRASSVRQLHGLIEAMSPAERADAWRQILATGPEWEDACDAFGLQPRKRALEGYLFSDVPIVPPSRPRHTQGEVSPPPRGQVETAFITAEGYLPRVCELIDGALEHVDMAAYCIGRGSAPVLDALLRAAADRAVAVTLLVDGVERRGDGGRVARNRRKMEELCAGASRVEVHFGRVHAKAVVVDRTRALVGSSNVYRPTAFETNIETADRDVVRALVDSIHAATRWAEGR